MFENKNIILASKSPRRQELLKGLGIDFKIITKEVDEVYPQHLKKEVDEVYPQHLKKEEVAIYLAELKARAFNETLNENHVIITADTIVCLNDEILEKPIHHQDAVEMLSKLSGNQHEVITGVSIRTKNKFISFYDVSIVHFKVLTLKEIEYYINHFQPYDKAGAYGIQEWIGYIGITKIEGSYFNVVGLPVHKLYEELKKFEV